MRSSIKPLRGPWLAVAGLGMFLPSVSLGQPAASTSARPNVLLIMIDDHAAQLQSAFGGNGRVPTPNLERLAARSTWFTHA